MLFPRPTQTRRRCRRQPTFQLGQGSAGPDGGHGGGQPEPGRGGVVHVVGGHGVHPPFGGQEGQRVVARRVQRIPVIPQFDGHVVAPEGVDQPPQLSGGRPRSRFHQRGGHRPLPTTGQNQPMVTRPRRQRLEREDRSTLLPALQVGFGQHTGQPGIPFGVAGQHDQMGPGRIRLTGPRAGWGQRHLAPKNGGQPECPGRLGKPHRPVEPVVIGQGQCGQAEPVGLGHQFLGVAAAIEEAEVGVDM
jgi:hypothetical protein